MNIPAIAVLGTASDVGKTAIAGALCRIFSQRGYRVAPFKAQNMSNNAFVCSCGGEIGRAQAMQARAAGVTPRVEMNPILLKPEADRRSQVVVMGRATSREDARTYLSTVNDRFDVVQRAYSTLCVDSDVAVIEGAGGAAEINLWDRDIVNWKMAEAADAPVVLVGDISRGGIFAQLLGTLDLLPPPRRRRVIGLVVNGFRGDASLFDDGVLELERRSGLPVLGVIPWVRDLMLETEDGISVPDNDGSKEAEIRIAVIRLPRLANSTDFEILAHEPDVELRYVTGVEDIARADVVIVPGTKSTAADLAYLKSSGLADAVGLAQTRGTEIVGICGGMQMLGTEIRDPDAIEGPPLALGLGVLPVSTTMKTAKTTRQITGVANWNGLSGLHVSGYEIHIGTTVRLGGRAAFRLASRQEGIVSDDGLAWGTYLHGVFDEPHFRRSWLNRVRVRLGLAALPVSTSREVSSRAEQAIQRFADHVRQHIDMGPIDEALGEIRRPSVHTPTER